MRIRLALLAPVVLGVLALGGCGDDPEPIVLRGDAPAQAPSQDPGQDPSQDPGQSPDQSPDGEAPEGDGGQLEAGDEATCEQVRAGIDAFNDQDYDETVDRFEDAVPLAKQAAADVESEDAALLLEAVRYYADLAPADYPAAAVGSPEFLAYKAITLGQCYGADNPQQQPEGSPEPPGVFT